MDPRPPGTPQPTRVFFGRNEDILRNFIDLHPTPEYVGGGKGAGSCQSFYGGKGGVPALLGAPPQPAKGKGKGMLFNQPLAALPPLPAGFNFPPPPPLGGQRYRRRTSNRTRSRRGTRRKRHRKQRSSRRRRSRSR